MPAADWSSISNGAGVFAIVADGTAPSPPDVMQITGGGQMFQNLTSGTFRDSRVSAWTRQSVANSSPLYLALRSLNTTFIANPATMFLTTIYAESTTTVNYTISAIVAGVVTNIIVVSLAPLNGNPVNSWQQFRFSAFNSGTDILLRTEQWNGAAFVPVVDCAAPIASFPALNVVGRCRFGALIGGGTNSIDDVNFYSLT